MESANNDLAEDEGFLMPVPSMVLKFSVDDYN
jgi:hypothetical protein